MDITWPTIFKVMIAGLGTYILLPAFLVFRDAVLWWAINRYVLNDQAQINVKRYVELHNEWNSDHAGKRVSTEDGEKFDRHFNRSEHIRSELRKLQIDLDRRAKFLNWILKHYNQEPVDPINEWRKDEE